MMDSSASLTGDETSGLRGQALINHGRQNGLIATKFRVAELTDQLRIRAT